MRFLFRYAMWLVAALAIGGGCGSEVADNVVARVADTEITAEELLQFRADTPALLRSEQEGVEALKDYVEAVKIDYDLAEGPSWVERLLYYDDKPSSALARAQYIYKQLQLPKSERLMRVPEEDDKQRMYKP